MTDQYDEFAAIYSGGPYTQYSQRMAQLLPETLGLFAAQPQRLLDLACGEGAFAVAMAERGLQVTGADLSPQMLALARARADRSGVTVDFQQHDLRALPFEAGFDLVTCWFDSLNYLLEPGDLELAFGGAARALQPGGLFIFDMNTRYGLIANWQRQTCLVEHETDQVFVVHRIGFDYERDLANIRITGFVKADPAGLWQRMDELHQERGYTLEQMRSTLAKAGLQELACWGSLLNKTLVQPDSGRVWFVTRKT